MSYTVDRLLKTERWVRSCLSCCSAWRLFPFVMKVYALTIWRRVWRRSERENGHKTWIGKAWWQGRDAIRQVLRWLKLIFHCTDVSGTFVIPCLAHSFLDDTMTFLTSTGFHYTLAAAAGLYLELVYIVAISSLSGKLYQRRLCCSIGFTRCRSRFFYSENARSHYIVVKESVPKCKFLLKSFLQC